MGNLVTAAGRSNPLDFTGSTAVVTGASRGIGQAIAKTLIECGAAVAITSTGAAPEWLGEYEKASHFPLDFTREESLDAFLTDVASVGAVDILVNNAGVHQLEAVDQISAAACERLFRVNLYGPTILTRHFAAKMKANRRGRIVNVASIAGTVCRPNASVYSSTKLGLIGLTRATAVELAPFGVLVNAVSPGTTSTDMTERMLTAESRSAIIAAHPSGRFAEPAEIANVVAFLASAANTYITGQNIIVDGGTTIT